MKDDIINKLIHHEILSQDECFDLSVIISQYLNSSNKENNRKGRELIIRVLDNWNNINTTFQPIFVDLLSSAGFYPYVEKYLINKDELDEEIRLQYHKSQNLQDRTFHSEQKEIVDIIKDKKNIIVSAPTSFGKSMLIEEAIASEMYSNIVVIQPTLALLDETRRKLKKYANKYKIIVRTSQAISEKKGNIFLLTAERVLEYQNLPEIDLLVLDEFYKLSNKRGDNRNNILNTAFLRIMKNPNCQFYMLGPNVDSIPDGFTQKYNAIFYKTNYSMVLTDEINEYSHMRKKKSGKIFEDDLFDLLDGIKDQTLIFCSSPDTARRLAFQYCSRLETRGYKPSKKLPLVSWINENLSFRWSLSKCLQFQIAVHDGAMPKHITSSTIRYFNDCKIKFLFCTNTIIEGVNTSAKNVIFYDNKIGKRKIDYFDYSNIKGRAGRLMKHYVGNIINLHEPPHREKTNVDFPFFVQNPIDSEVLVNLEESEVKDIGDNKRRYSDFQNKDFELQQILKRNAVSIEGQEKILHILINDLKSKAKIDLIIWSQLDGLLYKRLMYIFDLCWENLTTETERSSFESKGWIVNKIVSSCYKVSTNSLIARELAYRAERLAQNKNIPFLSVEEMFIKCPIEMQEHTDEIIKSIFSLQKNWLQYRAPKWINVVDSLQKYATKQLGLPSGDYSYVAEMIENSFIPSNFRILLEYGIPQTTINKIQSLLLIKKVDTKNITEDDLLSILADNKDYFRKNLTEYEIEILTNAL